MFFWPLSLFIRKKTVTLWAESWKSGLRMNFFSFLTKILEKEPFSEEYFIENEIFFFQVEHFGAEPSSTVDFVEKAEKMRQILFGEKWVLMRRPIHIHSHYKSQIASFHLNAVTTCVVHFSLNAIFNFHELKNQTVKNCGALLSHL